MTFNEFLNVDNDNSDQIFEFYLNYLLELSTKDFPYEEQLKLKGISGKFINCIDKTAYIQKERIEGYSKLIDELTIEIRRYRKIKNSSKFLTSIIFSRKNKIFHIQEIFEEIYSKTLEYINEASKSIEYRIDSLKINDFYKPENSNKKLIKDLIEEAILLIHNDNTITEKTKKQIVDYLNRVLKKLEYQHINWTLVIGNISEIILILGALGSFVGGITPLLQAKEKLKETTIIIEKTSINLNYNSINETFNIQNVEKIGELNTTILRLNEAKSENK
ncbi:hypothetical protein AAIP55_002146 [Flavobacterium psychrophilum]|nr:hypothetical protein [Flavobacterium psychrophilum]